MSGPSDWDYLLDFVALGCSFRFSGSFRVILISLLKDNQQNYAGSYDTANDPADLEPED